MKSNLKFLVYVGAIFFGIVLGELYINRAAWGAEGGFYETYAGDKFAIVHEGQLNIYDTSIVEVVSRSFDCGVTKFRLVGGKVRIVVSPDYYYKIK